MRQTPNRQPFADFVDLTRKPAWLCGSKSEIGADLDSADFPADLNRWAKRYFVTRM
jgi:hypothetical protein